ncbi:hypothetical protein CBR_g45539 [Chara braunii]|uniref:Uncharacterized protein n=1 Tax=Chara braunii TaxID=69332 RepID=A0A388LYS6_CHABU|nr:hypothetical protein CBR_g45539 [Chara braunii]|eukprot:GBG87480.1 hypothetical protein CBR_g45539 [Chara braunii]
MERSLPRLARKRQRSTGLAHGRQVRSYEAQNGNAGPRTQYKLGDIVQVRKCARQGKLAPRFFGQYRVIELGPNGVDTMHLAPDHTPHVLSPPSSLCSVSFSINLCRRRLYLLCISFSFSISVGYAVTIVVAMSFMEERALSEEALVPRGNLTLWQVYHPRLSPDLQRLAQFFCSRGVYAAAEIHVNGRADAIILAEDVGLQQRASAGVGRITVVVNFSGDLMAIPPCGHTRIKVALLLWVHNLQNEWTHLLTHQGDVITPIRAIKYNSLRLDRRCRRLLTQELTVPIAQLADDLDVSIVSQVDPRLVPHVTSRALSPYLQWSACVEGFPSRIPPSRLDYLDPLDMVDPAFYRPPYEDELEEIIREELAEGSSEEEEENPNEDEGEPAQQQEGEEDELLQTENKEEEEEEDNKQGSGDENDEEHTDEDPQLEIASVADLPISNDPTQDPEPPLPGDGDVAQMVGPSIRRPPSPPRHRRRSRFPSASLSLAARPVLRARRDEADRSSSSGSLSPTP